MTFRHSSGRSCRSKSTSSAPATRRKGSCSSQPRCAPLSSFLPISQRALKGNNFCLRGEQELDGVPADTIAGYQKEGDKYRVTFKVRTSSFLGLHLC